MAELIFSCNSLIHKFPFDFCVFFDKPEPLWIDLNFPVLGSINISKFDGTIIATSLETALSAREIYFSNDPIYFYCYNLEWTYTEDRKQFYQDLFKTNIKVIARCEDHAKKIKEDFGIDPIFIQNTLNVTQIVERIKNDASITP